MERAERRRDRHPWRIDDVKEFVPILPTSIGREVLQEAERRHDTESACELDVLEFTPNSLLPTKRHRSLAAYRPRRIVRRGLFSSREGSSQSIAVHRSGARA